MRGSAAEQQNNAPRVKAAQSEVLANISLGPVDQSGIAGQQAPVTEREEGELWHSSGSDGVMEVMAPIDGLQSHQN